MPLPALISPPSLSTAVFWDFRRPARDSNCPVCTHTHRCRRRRTCTHVHIHEHAHVHMHIHTYIHTQGWARTTDCCTLLLPRHIRTHTHTHTCTHTGMNSCLQYVCVCTCVHYTKICMMMYTIYEQILFHTRPPTHLPAYANTHAFVVCTEMSACMSTHMHTHAHTCTHMHTHAHTCTHTHTHAHTCTHMICIVPVHSCRVYGTRSTCVCMCAHVYACMCACVCMICVVPVWPHGRKQMHTNAHTFVCMTCRVPVCSCLLYA